MNLAQKMASEAVKRQRGKTHSCSTCVMVRFFVTPRWRGGTRCQVQLTERDIIVCTVVFNREKFDFMTKSHKLCSVTVDALNCIHCVLYTYPAVYIVYRTQIHIVYCTHIQLCTLYTVHRSTLCTVHRSSCVHCVLYTDPHCVLYTYPAMCIVYCTQIHIVYCTHIQLCVLYTVH